MKKEHRSFIVLKLRDKWCVFCNKKKVSVGFDSRIEAENYKQFLVSR